MVLKLDLKLSMGTKKEEQTDLMEANRTEVIPPSFYKVLLLNDDYTTMDFVILVLKKFFNKTEEEAHSLMMEIHLKGQAVCGIYTFEVAESKVSKVNKFSKENGHPLKCISESE